MAAMISAKDLPGPQDTRVMIPPVRAAHVRRVPKCNVWIYFEVNANGDVVFITVTDTPPPPAAVD